MVAIGSSAINGVYVGTDQVQAMYLGTTQVYTLHDYSEPTLTGLGLQFRMDGALQADGATPAAVGSAIAFIYSRIANTEIYIGNKTSSRRPTLRNTLNSQEFGEFTLDGWNSDFLTTLGTDPTTTIRDVLIVFRVDTQPTIAYERVLIINYPGSYDNDWIALDWNSNNYRVLASSNYSPITAHLTRAILDGVDLTVTSGAASIPQATIGIGQWHWLLLQCSSSRNETKRVNIGGEGANLGNCGCSIADLITWNTNQDGSALRQTAGYVNQRYGLAIAQVTISGTQTIGQTLTAAISDFSGVNSPTYQWRSSTDGSSWSNLSGETASTLALTATHSNKYVQCYCIWTTDYSDAHSASESTGVIQSAWIVAYRARIAANSGSVSEADYAALETFIQALITESLITATPTTHSATNSVILDLSPLAGENLTSARCKLIVCPSTVEIMASTGFVSGDYTRTTGIQGGSGKYFDSGVNISTRWLNNTKGGYGFYNRSATGGSNTAVMASGNARCYVSGTRGYTCELPVAWSTTNTVATADLSTNFPGFVIAQRLTTTALQIWTRSVKRSEVTTFQSVAYPNANIQYMAQSGSTFSTLSFGLFMQTAQGIPEAKIPAFTTAVNTLMAAFGRNV